MSLLNNGINKKSVILTDNKKKLTIDGHTENYSVYKIKLDELYYNDQNDRIATWISKYKLENNIDKIDIVDREKYNKIIHNFIKESNPEALKKTQANIKFVGQLECGVVLDDGRIIDGNRRFTCLRNIEKETMETQYFECIILERNVESDAKAIKILELQLQYVDERVAYSPIDRLVGIYNDIVDKELLTIKEYAKGIGCTEKDIEKEVSIAELIVEFLDFIHAPKQFYLLREMELYSPIEELYKILKKRIDYEKKEEIKDIVFTNFIMQPFGDMTRYVRKIGKVVSNNRFSNDYIEEQLEEAEKVLDIIEKQSVITIKTINEKIRNQDDIKEELNRSTEKWVAKVDSETNKNQPAKQVERAYETLESIDTYIFKKLTKEQKEDINERIQMLEEIVEENKLV